MSGTAMLLAQAAGHYQAGRIAAAAEAARAALRGSPGHPGALHLLAAARLAAGAVDEGGALLERALAASTPPQRDEIALHLAQVRAAQGRPAEVVTVLGGLAGRVLAALGPLAAAQWETGDRDGAIATYRALLAHRPGDAAVHRNLGNALRQHGDAAGGAAALRRAVALDPGDAEGWIGLAEAHGVLARAAPAGNADDIAAGEAAEAALARHPADPRALLRLGVVLHAAGRLEGALSCLDRVDPDAPGIDAGTLLVERANVLSKKMRHGEAAACYHALLAREPDNVAAQVNLSLLHLLAGDHAAGWPRYEWRRRLLTQLAQPQDPLAAPWLAPVELHGSTVRLVLEQGHGDTLHFIRYLPLLTARGARVEVAMPIQPGLAPLLEPLATLVKAADTAPLADVTLPLLSLPLAFGTDAASIPAEVPYLSVPEARQRIWRDRLGDGAAPRIGVVWAGSPTHGNDRQRSIALEQFMVLMRRRDLAFHVLADRLREGEAAQLDGVARVHEGLADFADTAALVEAMDLVISVDTSVAHLAGALGRPVWILLPRNPDWRWLLGRDDSPWYPTARLFRQTAHQDWGGVLARVNEAIDATFP